MHVLLIHSAFVSPNEPGGTRHYELARKSVDQGYRFTIVASTLSYLTGKETNAAGRGLVNKHKVDDINILRAYTYPSYHKSFIWRVLSFLSFMLTSVVAALRPKSIDLVMGTSPPIFQAVSAWAVARIRRCPFLLEIRDLWPDFAIGMGILKNPVLIRLSRWLEGFLYRSATHIMVNSPAYRDYLLLKGIDKGKITLVTNGVDTTMFRPDDGGTSFRNKWSLNGKFVATYAGALGMANDIPIILRAANRLKGSPRIHFLLVGDGKERPALEELAARLDLSNVTFTGIRPKNEMPEILAASDACIAILKDIPMFRTTYPNKVFDYMAAARPTILAIDGVIRDVIESSGGGIFVPPGDERSLAAVVQSLESDRESAQGMGRMARQFAVEHFDRTKQGLQFTELLKRLIS